MAWARTSRRRSGKPVAALQLPARRESGVGTAEEWCAKNLTFWRGQTGWRVAVVDT
jgi:hypothetical protein